jgi:hypothetical protein
VWRSERYAATSSPDHLSHLGLPRATGVGLLWRHSGTLAQPRIFEARTRRSIVGWVNVHITPTARWYIRRRGGTVYVWGKTVGGKSGSALVRTSTRSRPTGVQFDPIERDGITVWFDRELVIDDVAVGWSLFSGGIDVTYPDTIPTV